MRVSPVVLALSGVLVTLAPACAGRNAFPLDASSQSPPIAREASAEEVPARILSERIHLVLDDQGGWKQTRVFRYRVLNHMGVENWSSYSAHWQPWFQAQPEVDVTVTDPDGATHKLDLATLAVSPVYPDMPDLYSDARMVRAPIPAVSVGSVVEEKTVTRTTRPFFVGGSVHSFVVQTGIPRDLIEISVEMPASVPFAYEIRDAKVEVSDTKNAGRRKVVFTGRSLEAIKAPESLMPSDVPRWPHIVMGTATSWEQVAQAYSRQLAERLDGHGLEDAARKLVSDGDPAPVKAKKLLAWLRSRVRYAGVQFGMSAIIPARPADTLHRAYGDCKDQATVLVALLRSVGVDAKVALLRTGPGEDVRDKLPGLNVFDHAIVVIPGDKPMWIDPTSPFARAGDLPIMDQDRLALVIDDEVEGLTRTPAGRAEDNTYEEVRTVYLADHGKPRVVEVSLPKGALEQDMRSSFDGTKDDARKGLEKYVESTYGSKELADFDLSPSRNLEMPFRLQVEAKEANVGDTGLMDAFVRMDETPLFSYLPDAVKAKDERKTDLVLPTPYRARIVYRIVPPEGFEAGPLPRVQPLDLGPAKLERSFSVGKDGVLEGRFELSVDKRRLTPADVEAMKKGFEAYGKEQYAFATFEHRGHRLMGNNQTAQGLAIFRQLADAHPDDEVHAARMAVALSDAGFGLAARKLAREAVEKDPKSALAHLVLGDILSCDAFGRTGRVGYDRKGAIDAYRKAAELDDDDVTARVYAALLLEYDDEGRRYEDPKGLEAAVAEYDAIDPQKLLEFRDGEHATNALYDLVYAGKYQEVLRRAKSLPANMTPHALIIAAATAGSGVMSGLAEADRYQLHGEQRSESLAGAAEILFRLRLYPQAATLYDTASQNSPNAAAYATRASFFRRTKRVDVQALPASTPEQVAIKTFAVFSSGKDIDPGLRAELMSSRTPYEKDGRRVENNLRTIGKVFLDNTDTPLAVLVDIYVSSLTATKVGDDRSGYRVIVTSSGVGDKTYTNYVYLVKEGGKYRVRAGEGHPSEIGEEALYALKHGNRKLAEQWLDWAEDLTGAGSGTDPLRAPPGTQLWQGKKDPKVAAAALCAGGICSEQAVGILREALNREKDPLRRGALLKALILAYWKLENYEQWLRTAEQLKKAFPDSDQARSLHLQALWNLKRYRDHRAAANDWLKQDPDAVGLHATVAQAEVQLGDFEAAVKAYQKLIDTGRASASSFNSRAWLAPFRGNVTDEDLGHALRAAQMSNFASTPELHTLATIYAEIGKPSEAMQTLKKLLELRPKGQPEEVDWYVVGRIAETYGLPDAARAAYERVTKPEHISRTSTYHLAQRRLKAMKR